MLILEPLRRIADFRGRSRRAEFWLFQFVIWGVFAVLVMIAAKTHAPFGGAIFWIATLAMLPLVVALMAVEVRRFHDQGLPTLCILINAVPYIGFFIVLIFMCIGGTKGPNNYGPDPRKTS